MVIEDLALLFVRGVDSRVAAHLVDYFGSAEAVFNATIEQLTRGAQLREDIARRILCREGVDAAKRELSYCRKHNITILAATDADYPPLLRESSDRPHILFVRGNVEALGCRTLAMVGTSEVSASGLSACDKLLFKLSQMVDNLCVVSGLGYGIDSACHRAALTYNIPSIAVLPCALPSVVPSSHSSLAEDILHHGGALVSELPSTAQPSDNQELACGRIIAALSMGTLVVEAYSGDYPVKVATIADSYGRMVMALPGRISDSSYMGSNNLIRSSRAHLVLTAADICEDMGWSGDSVPQMAELTAEEQEIYALIRDGGRVELLQLMAAVTMNFEHLAQTLIALQARGIIVDVGDRCYSVVEDDK